MSFMQSVLLRHFALIGPVQLREVEIEPLLVTEIEFAKPAAGGSVFDGSLSKPACAKPKL